MHGLHRQEESGFTLVELLTVMLIIGIIAAIALPLFLSQRARAHDTSTKADLVNAAKEIETYFVDGLGPLTVDGSSPGQLTLHDGAGWSSVVNLTNGTAIPTVGSWAHLDDPNGWCISLTDTQGDVKDYKITPSQGLTPGTCA